MSPLLSAFAGSLIALSTFSHASPIPKAKQGVTIHQKISKQAFSGPAHLARLYFKYNSEIPQDLLPALTNIDVTATPGANDAGYLCPVGVGGQTLNLDLDTGSADLWVFSTELSSSDSAGHATYDSTKSSNAKELTGATWDITYADGSYASGNVYLDSVTIDDVTVGQQAVELAQQVSSSFQQDTSLDGLLGLGFSSLNTVKPQQQLTFFDNAVQQGLLADNVFTVDLKAGQPGSFEFGHIDPNKYTGDITYTPVNNSSGFWDITATGFGFGNQNVNRRALESVKYSGIVDTGTSLLVLDDSLVSKYWGSVSGAVYEPNQGGYVFPCSATLPDLEIGIETSTAIVPGAYMNFASIDGTTCYGGMQNNAGLGLSIFGDVFIKSQFIVFDEGNMQIGIAAKDLGRTTSGAQTTALPTLVSTQLSTPCASSLYTTFPFEVQTSSETSSMTSTSLAIPASTLIGNTTVAPSIPSSTISVSTLIGTSPSVSSSVSAPTLVGTSSSVSYDDGMWHTTYNHYTSSSTSSNSFVTLVGSDISTSTLLTTTLLSSTSSTTSMSTATLEASNSSTASTSTTALDTSTNLPSILTVTITSTVELTEATTTPISSTTRTFTTLYGFPSLALNATAPSLGSNATLSTTSTSAAALTTSNTASDSTSATIVALTTSNTTSVPITAVAGAYTTMTLTTGTASDATTVLTVYTGLATSIAAASTASTLVTPTSSTLSTVAAASNATVYTPSSLAYPTLAGYGNSTTNGKLVRRQRLFHPRV